MPAGAAAARHGGRHAALNSQPRWSHVSRLQVPRLQSLVRDRRANWEQSLSVLRAAKVRGHPPCSATARLHLQHKSMQPVRPAAGAAAVRDAQQEAACR